MVRYNRKQSKTMKQSIILPESFYISATGCGFEVPSSMIEHVEQFLSCLKGLEYSSAGREGEFIHLLNGELTPEGESNEGWDYLILEWEAQEVQENLKLYRVGIAYGECIVAAKNRGEVLNVILKNDSLRSDFSDLSGNIWPKIEILKFITPIEGYEIKGKSGVISYYRE